ncbi:hypothetical protein ABPG75_009648 [Micractinium tetrahymenae]
MALVLAAAAPVCQARPRPALKQAPRRILGRLPHQRGTLFCRAQKPEDASKEPLQEGGAPPAQETAEVDEAPSDEEVAALVATDPADRAPGQEEPHSEDEADPSEFYAVMEQERQQALREAEQAATAEGEEGAERETGVQGA